MPVPIKNNSISNILKNTAFFILLVLSGTGISAVLFITTSPIVRAQQNPAFTAYHTSNPSRAEAKRLAAAEKAAEDVGATLVVVTVPDNSEPSRLAGVSNSIMPRFFAGDPKDEDWVSEVKVNNGGLRWLRSVLNDYTPPPTSNQDSQQQDQQDQQQDQKDQQDPPPPNPPPPPGPPQQQDQQQHGTQQSGTPQKSSHSQQGGGGQQLQGVIGQQQQVTAQLLPEDVEFVFFMDTTDHSWPPFDRFQKARNAVQGTNHPWYTEYIYHNPNKTPLEQVQERLPSVAAQITRFPVFVARTPDNTKSSGYRIIGASTDPKWVKDKILEYLPPIPDLENLSVVRRVGKDICASWQVPPSSYGSGGWGWMESAWYDPDGNIVRRKKVLNRSSGSWYTGWGWQSHCEFNAMGHKPPPGEYTFKVRLITGDGTANGRRYGPWTEAKLTVAE